MRRNRNANLYLTRRQALVRRGRDGFDDPRVEAGGASGSIDQGLHSHAGGRARAVLFRSQACAHRHHRRKARRASCAHAASSRDRELRLLEGSPGGCLALRRAWGLFRLCAPGDGSSEGETFLRGTQFTDADGAVCFTTIYPGWYPGRTPHIHFKVILDDKDLVTGQLYFPDTISERIYATVSPYRERKAERVTFNAVSSSRSRAAQRSFPSRKTAAPIGRAS